MGHDSAIVRAPGRWPPVPSRAEQVDRAIREALAKYRSALDACEDVRSVAFDVKFKNDGSGIRTVVVSIQGET